MLCFDDAGLSAPRDHANRLRIDRGFSIAGHQAPFGFAHDLAGDDDDVAVTQSRFGDRNERREVVARDDLAETLNTPNPK